MPIDGSISRNRPCPPMGDDKLLSHFHIWKIAPVPAGKWHPVLECSDRGAATGAVFVLVSLPSSSSSSSPSSQRAKPVGRRCKTKGYNRDVNGEPACCARGCGACEGRCCTGNGNASGHSWKLLARICCRGSGGGCCCCHCDGHCRRRLRLCSLPWGPLPCTSVGRVT